MKLRRLTLIGYVEGTSLLLLIGIAVPLKHFFHMPLPTKIMGTLHGLAFLAYAAAVLDALGTGRLTRGEAARAMGAAFLPGVTFLFARSLARRESP